MTYNDYDSLVDSVSNIIIGTRNYLSGTEDWSDNIGSNSTILDDTYNGMYVAYNDGTGTSTSKRNLGSWTTDFVIEPSTYYTISFWAKGSGTITTYLASAVESGVNDTGNTTTSSDGAITTTLSENWTRHWVTYKTLDSITDEDIFTFIPGRCTSGSECYMCGVKLEYGNKSSDWSLDSFDSLGVALNNLGWIEELTISADSTITVQYECPQKDGYFRLLQYAFVGSYGFDIYGYNFDDTYLNIYVHNSSTSSRTYSLRASVVYIRYTGIQL